MIFAEIDYRSVVSVQSLLKMLVMLEVIGDVHYHTTKMPISEDSLYTLHYQGYNPIKGSNVDLRLLKMFGYRNLNRS